MDIDSNSDDEIYCGYGSSDGEGAENVDKKTTCGYCSENFEDCDDDNRPVINPCGCVLHWYCRWKRSEYLKDGDGRRCPSCGAIECSNCKKLRYKIKKLTLKNAKLKSQIAGQPAPPPQQQKQEENGNDKSK